MSDKHYSLDYLNSISDGDQDFIKDMLETFVSSVPDELSKMWKLVNAENWQKVGEDAHKFASSLVFLGLNDLKQIATKIEEHGIQQNNVSQIPVLLNELEKGCTQLITELKRDFDV
ncbi:MAG TPA: Hpt domain-containing protein [Bacteroidales bacterium]|jgi:FOG: HPt domain